MLIEEILIVKHDEVYFGIPSASIAQILRIPEITPLAMSPEAVHGLCAVGGNIITAIDMNHLIGLKEVETTSFQSRLLSLNEPYSASGLVVSEVVVSIGIDEENIEYIPNPIDSIVAIYHYGEKLIQIIDPGKLLQMLEVDSISLSSIDDRSNKHAIKEAVQSDSDRYLLFKMGEETFAILIDHLREILSAHYSLTPITGSNREIAGMISLRDELLVVADLRIFFGYAPKKSDKNRIILVQSETKIIGLLIDEIVDINEFSSQNIDLYDRNGSNQLICGVIHNGDHLISLIGKETIDTLIRQNDSSIVSNKNDITVTNDENSLEVVVFKLADEEYAFPIERVSEIIDTTAITPVASSPDTVEGVINIRGQIVTIGSLHKQLGINERKSENQKIIICQANKGRIGFFVDSVSNVMSVSKNEVISESDQDKIFSAVLHLNQGERLVMLFDLESLHLVRGK